MNRENSVIINALRGAVAILFGLIALFNPGIALGVLIILFAVFLLADGVFALFNVIRRADRRYTRTFIIEAVVGIAVGSILLLRPITTISFLVFLFGLWSFVTGISRMLTAYALRKEVQNERVMFLHGFLSTLFGLFLFMYPLVGITTLVMAIGIFEIGAGAVMLFNTFRKQAAGRNVESHRQLRFSM